jgi:hypothetical protein
MCIGGQDTDLSDVILKNIHSSLKLAKRGFQETEFSVPKTWAGDQPALNRHWILTRIRRTARNPKLTSLMV